MIALFPTAGGPTNVTNRFGKACPDPVVVQTRLSRAPEIAPIAAHFRKISGDLTPEVALTNLEIQSKGHLEDSSSEIRRFEFFHPIWIGAERTGRAGSEAPTFGTVSAAIVSPIPSGFCFSWND